MKTEISTNKERIAELSNKIKSFGYDVYLSESQTYGFFCLPDGQKLISFQIDYFFFSFSANHISKGLGSGYRITSDEQCLLWEIEKWCTKEFLEGLINAPAYQSYKTNEVFIKWTNIEEHFKSYQSSSKYQIV